MIVLINYKKIMQRKAWQFNFRLSGIAQIIKNNNQLLMYCYDAKIEQLIIFKTFKNINLSINLYFLKFIYLMGCFGSNPSSDKQGQPTQNPIKKKEDIYKIKQTHRQPKQQQPKQFPYLLEKHTLMNDYLRLVNKEQFSKTLHMMIGALLFDIEEYKYDVKGTAFLISKNLIVTAAHNICHRNFSPIRYSKSLRFFPGVTGEVNLKDDFYEIQQGQWRIPNQYEKIDLDLILPFDYALVKLADSIKKSITIKEFYPLFIQCQQCPANLASDYSELKIYGYPSYEDNFKPMQEWTIILNQYGDSKQKYVIQAKASQRKIKYMMSTLTGQSGAPVVSQRGIVGVHLGSGKASENYNIGRLNTLQMIQNLQQWAQQLRGQPFQINREQFCEHLNEKKKDKSKKEQQMDLSFNGLQSIDIKIYPLLKILHLQGNKLKKIDLSKNTRLTQLSLSDNQIEQINLQANSQLQQMFLGHNQLSSINLSENTQLKMLSLQYNQIQQIDLSKNVQLQQLWLYNNNIKQINLAKNTQLSLLRLYNNQLTKIDISKNEKLSQIRLYSNKITQIKMPSNSQLKELWLHNNKLTKIDTSNIKLLELIRLDRNLLAEIDLSQNKLLQRIDLQDNRLKKVLLWFNAQMHWGFNEGISLNDQNSNQCEIFFYCKYDHKNLLKYFIEQGTKGFTQRKKEHFIDKYKCNYKLQIKEKTKLII